MAIYKLDLTKAQFILSLLFVNSCAQATAMDACYQAEFTQVDRVVELPQEIVESIQANDIGERSFSALPQEQQSFIKLGGSNAIADKGGPFQPGCADDGKTPMRRLVMAAISTECILVAIEHGGAGHGAGLRVFLREGDAWVRGDKFEHPSAYLSYQGKFDTDLPTFITQAEFQLGEAFKYGQGINKNPVESLKWYSLAANKGYSPAQFEVGKIYAEGRGTDKNLKTALDWFEKAALQSANWQYRLGLIYLDGTLVPQDVKKGLQLVNASERTNNTDARAYLGKLYLEGKYVKQDYAEAIKLFRNSIQFSYNGARYNLGNMYKNGLGVKKDLVVAWALLYGSGFDTRDVRSQLEQLMVQHELQDAKQLKNEMDGNFSPQGKYQAPGVLNALDSYLAHQ